MSSSSANTYCLFTEPLPGSKLVGVPSCIPDPNVYAELMTILTDLTVAAPNNTGFVCPNPACGAEMSRRSWGQQRKHYSFGLNCTSCKKMVKEGTFSYNKNAFAGEVCPIRVVSRSAHLMNKEEVPQERWFHATKRGNWAEAIQSASTSERGGLMVHVGDRETAMERAKDTFWNRTFYLYEVSIAPDTRILDGIVDDENSWPTFKEEMEGEDANFPEYVGVDAVRYVNRYEAPGSISLLVDAKKLIVKKKLFTRVGPRNVF